MTSHSGTLVHSYSSDEQHRQGSITQKAIMSIDRGVNEDDNYHMSNPHGVAVESMVLVIAPDQMGTASQYGSLPVEIKC